MIQAQHVQNLVYHGSGLTLHWNINIMVQTQHGLESSLSGFRIKLMLKQYHGLGSACFRIQSIRVQDYPYTGTSISWFRLRQGLESSLSGFRIKLILEQQYHGFAQHGLKSSLSGFRIKITLEQQYHGLESSLSGFRIKLTLCHVGCTTYTRKVKYVFETRE